VKITILILFISCAIVAQNKHPETDFYLYEKKMFWEHVFDAPGQSQTDLMQYFEKYVLTNFKQNNFQIFENTISFEMVGDVVNYKKYGGSTMGTVIFATMQMNYLVVIDFKDDRYKVRIKDINLDDQNIGLAHSSGKLEEYTTKKSITEFQSNKLVTTGLQYQHLNFMEKFQINPQISANKDW
jgi:uncharacterized protein (UPF0333 family)